MKHRAIASTIIIALFLLIFGVGVLWYFLRYTIDQVSAGMLSFYPSGVYPTNNLAAIDFALYATPIVAAISILLFVYISVKRRSRREDPYLE